MLFPIAILPGDDKHAWGVEVPDIPGCFSSGEDLDNVIAMAREAIEGHIELLAQDQQEIPKASLVSVHAANPAYAGCTWALIDITRYLGKAEKLNITRRRICSPASTRTCRTTRSTRAVQASWPKRRSGSCRGTASDRALASNGRRTLTHNSPSFQSDRDL